jgi:hypothetical protein
MPRNLRKRPVLALLAAALAIGLAAASALAAVTVYRNNFSNRTEAKELRHVEGKHCSKRLRKRAKALRILVERGRGVCGYRPPVQGDGPGPDHRLQVTAKLLRNTPKGVRDGAYVGVEVRVAKGESYELRVFPSRHHFELRRTPTGSGFPVTGNDSAIKGASKPNVVRIEATGNTVIGRVNGTKVGEATDSNASEVAGRKLELAIGHRRKSRKPVAFAVDTLKVQVPNP